MSEPRTLPRRIVVAGVGQVGALAALALKRALPSSEVLIAGAPPEPDAFADHAITALPFTNLLHERFGISEDVLIKRCGASHRLVTRYSGWGGEGQQGTAPYGAATDPAMKTAFAREWGGGPRNAQTGAEPGSLAEVLAAAGRFAAPTGSHAAPLADLDFALRWNGDAYRHLLAELAQQAGVRHVPGALGAAERDGEDGLASLQIGAAGTVQADLFVDCTGPAAALLSQCPEYAWSDWSTRLPTRQVLRGRPGQPVLALEDRVTLTAAGWRSEIGGRDGVHIGLGMPDAASEQDVLSALGGEPLNAASLAPGRARAAWCGNVVALGDAAARIDPLAGFDLDLAHRQLDLLLEMLPGREIDARERAEFNRRAALMAERTCDTIAAHYSAPRARDVSGSVELSDELALSLDQFERRGRTPFFEEMPLLVQEWAALLGALGIARGTGPLARRADHGPAVQAFRAKAEAALAAAPPYREWMQQVLAGNAA